MAIDHNPDHTIVEHLRKFGYGAKDLKPLEAYFDAMHLPLAGPSEFYATGDNGAIIFLSAVGCAVRFTHKHHLACEHPRILRPLMRKPIGDQLVADLNPGVFTPYTSKDYTTWGPIYRDTIEKELDAAGIKIEDINGCNAGVLPAPLGAYHVMIDPGCLKHIYNPNAKPVAPSPDDAQSKAFGKITSRFTHAWPGDTKEPDHKLLSATWRECSAMKKAGQLVAMWESFSYGNSKWAAQKYTETHGLQHALPA